MKNTISKKIRITLKDIKAYKNFKVIIIIFYINIIIKLS